MADWITTDEASQITGYSLAHLRDLLRQKKIKAEKRGGHYWIDRNSILEYAQKAAQAQKEDKRHGAKGRRTS
ncbi:MAG: helix-turn-helix domain-containing protein [Chloroflexi bacterium]|nr:helix-turn-helix domain-containing protein [Chloroflexota bacterium]